MLEMIFSCVKGLVLNLMRVNDFENCFVRKGKIGGILD